jgi:hypothetical protein
MTIYLFHNIYGDADELIATKPADCEAVPAGWNQAAEDYRNAVIATLNGIDGYSCLPSVIYFQPSYTITVIDNTTKEVQIVNCGNAWTEIRVEDMAKPWNWAAITSIIDSDKNKTVTYDSIEESQP